MALVSLASTLLLASGLPTLPDCTHELCPSTKYEHDAPSPVECEAEVGELQPEYFRTLGSWQKRYGRDNLALSRHFLDEIYQLQIEPRLGQALNLCPAAVLEIMMNCILAIETENGREAARDFLLYIYQLRDELFAKLPDDHRKEQLEKLMLEWNADIAYVYPKFLDVQRLGPNAALSDEQDLEEVCLGQRFFVYDLPKGFYGGTFECLQGQWGTEVLLHQYFRHNCKTNDPDAADWFYVPLHATCLYVKLNENVTEDLIGNMDEVSNRFIFDPMMDFLRKSRHFHRLNGADHIFLFADGQGPRIWDSYDLLRSDAVFLSPESRCPTWQEPLRRYVDVKRCLSSWKDLVIPGHTDYARIQYMKRHNKRSAERRLLLTFHGRAPQLHEAYGHCAVRGELMKLSRTRKLEDGVDIGGFVGDYLERKGDSHFCLVPAGTSPWTNHLYESFYAGCIPVILSDEYELAFMNDLPWENFSIKWPESRICDDEDCSRSALYDYLLSLVEEPQKLWHMKHQLELHSCFFNWYSTDLSCSPFALLHQHLKSLWDRRKARPHHRYWNAQPAFEDVEEDFAHLYRETRFKHFEDDSTFSWFQSRPMQTQKSIYAAEETHPKAVSPHPNAGWALVVGNEDKGVSPDVLECCDDFLCVPQVRGASLNVAHAAAICMYESWPWKPSGAHYGKLAPGTRALGAWTSGEQPAAFGPGPLAGHCPKGPLLGLVLWLGIAPRARSPSVDGTDRDLMLPLHSEFRREQRNLFDVNLFDDPDELYEEDPIETEQNWGAEGKESSLIPKLAVVNIYRAEICPDGDPLGCTAPVAHAITSILWLTAFVTSASSTCAASISNAGSCAAAILRDLATAGSTIYGFDEDCYLTKPRETSWRLGFS
eukprot:s1495_g15.t2